MDFIERFCDTDANQSVVEHRRFAQPLFVQSAADGVASTDLKSVEILSLVTFHTQRRYSFSGGTAHRVRRGGDSPMSIAGFAVLITPVQSSFSWTVTIAWSVVCLVVIGVAVFVEESRGQRR